VPQAAASLRVVPGLGAAARVAQSRTPPTGAAILNLSLSPNLFFGPHFFIEDWLDPEG
jgi:hypothetical protein